MSFERHAEILIDCYRDLVGTIRSATYRNARIGQALALFGILAFLGGYGLFLAGESLGYASENYWTYRRFAGVLAGFGLPALLYGLVVALPDVGRNSYVSLAGAVLCSAAVVLFFGTYPERWNVAGSPDYVVETVTLYGLGAMLCAAAAGGAVNCHFEKESITGFIWGRSPDR
ncbi:hypothetical protein ACFQE8_13460 [Salinirubellus sp. GCM10025818]|uniref:DUF7139 domain-containing protein n=1 Tax=Salinirubellus TaxID=2162630 RepID=UPI0030CFF162